MLKTSLFRRGFCYDGIMPSYFRQDYRTACGLAALRMVLASYGMQVSERDLLSKVEPEYGREFSNI